MKVSLYCSGQTIAEFSDSSPPRPTDSNVTRGSPLISVRRLRATHPDSPWPTFRFALKSRGASTPAAKRHLSVSFSGLCRNNAQPDHETIFRSEERRVGKEWIPRWDADG